MKKHTSDNKWLWCSDYSVQLGYGTPGLKSLLTHETDKVTYIYSLWCSFKEI